MTDPTYDTRVARLLEDYGRGGLRPIDPTVVASIAMSRARYQSRSRSVRTAGLLAAALVIVGGLAVFSGIGTSPAHGDAVIVTTVDPEVPTDHVASAWRADIATGTTTSLVTAQRFVSLAPDGHHVAYLGRDGVHIVDADSGTDRLIDGFGRGRARLIRLLVWRRRRPVRLVPRWALAGVGRMRGPHRHARPVSRLRTAAGRVRLHDAARRGGRVDRPALPRDR